MPRKKTTKKPIKKSKNNSKILQFIAWFLAIVALIMISIVAGYYLGFHDANVKPVNNKEIQKKNNALVLHKLEEKPKHKVQQKTVTKRLQEVLQKEVKSYDSAAHEIDDEALANPDKALPKKLIVYNTKPKLAIIIDDMSTSTQVNAVKSLHIPLTMSFLPPRPARPNSAKLAAHEKFYMVHLPMEAMHFSAEEPNTLRIHDSQQKISARIAQIKKEFPKVQYINNHTGSKFTSNEVAMNRLIFALNANKIHFIDSRTTAKTMAPKVLKNFGLKYVARDVFLDHKMDKAYVKGQIKEAIKVAKARGHCIAIGHPHKNTLAALAESKALFKDVDLVQVNKVY